MKIVLLDGAQITHEALAQRFSFPACYGRNLDALHDCLTDIAEETAIIVEHAADADPRILRVLRDSVKENPKLKIYG